MAFIPGYGYIPDAETGITPAKSLQDYAATLLSGIATDRANAAALKDTSAVDAAKKEVVSEKAADVALAKSLGATIDPQTGLITPPAGGYTPQSLAMAASGNQPAPAPAGSIVPPQPPATDKTVANKNALALLQSTLAGYGIDSGDGSISNAILGLIQSNYDASTIQALIESPTASSSSDPNVKALAGAWNTRFAGNVAREKAGLPPLSPSDYISTENSYKAVMARAGLDSAHMDPTKLAALIGADVSPAEVNQRVNAAMAAVTAEDPFVKQQLNQQFGLTNGDLVGHLLDPVTQASVIANKVTAAQVGAEASRAGIDVNAANAYALAAQGVTQAQAQQGFTSIAQQLPATQALASRYAGYGTAGGVGQALQTATFGAPGTQTQAQAEAELKRLQTQEISAFSGSSGAGKGSLGISDTSGLQ